LIWAAILPLFVLATLPVSAGWSLVLFGLYPLQVLRVVQGQRARGRSIGDACAYGISVVFAKFPQLHGLLRFVRNSILSRPVTLIEYKGPESS